MAERTYQMFNVPQSAYASTTPPAKVATGTARKTMLQVQADPLGPAIRIVEWGVGFDATALAVPVLCELVDTGNQGASSTNWTAAKMPVALLGTAITSAATTSLVLNSGGGANFPAATFSLIAAPILTTGALAGTFTGAREKIYCSSRSTDTLTVVRNIDGAGALAAMAVGSQIMGLDGQFELDIQCDNSGTYWPLSGVNYPNCGFNSGGGANGVDFGSVTRSRVLALQLVEPIGEGLLQLPLGRETEIAPGDFVRIVMTAPVGVNAVCYLKWSE